MSESRDLHQAITGRGLVSAAGCQTVRVRYRFVIQQGDEGPSAHGTLTGRHAGLRPIWLEPDAHLRLKSGRILAISLTDLIGDVAEFESVGPVADF